MTTRKRIEQLKKSAIPDFRKMSDEELHEFGRSFYRPGEWGALCAKAKAMSTEELKAGLAELRKKGTYKVLGFYG